MPTYLVQSRQRTRVRLRVSAEGLHGGRHRHPPGGSCSDRHLLRCDVRKVLGALDNGEKQEMDAGMGWRNTEGRIAVQSKDL